MKPSWLVMMKILLKILLLSSLFIVSNPDFISAQSELTFERESPPDMEMLMSVHERFVYNVRYGFFNLGEVEVELLPDTTYEGEQVLHMRTIMRAQSRNPLIRTRNVHYHNFFQFNEKWPYSFVFWRDDLHDENFERYKIKFDRKTEKVYFFEEGEAQDTLDIKEPASGGDIIFYYSRMFAGLEEPYEMPVFIDNEIGSVTASSSPRTEMRSYEAFPDEIETYKSEGHADIDGPFGFRGTFTSWFSTDDLRVPVEAHVRIIFGNVKIRLIEYERIGERNRSGVSEAGTR